MVILKKKVAGLSAQSLERFILRARKAAHLQGAVDVLVTSSTAMQSLNARFRGKDKPTDVLSFPAEPAPGLVRQPKFAGEIAISADIARANAHTLGHSEAEEVRVLVLHGILHLAGFDHERDNGTMARKEVRLRRALRLPLSLTERTDSAYQSPVSASRRSRITA